MRMKMGYPSHETERAILRSRATDDPVSELEPVADVADVFAMQETVTRVHVDTSLHDYALEIVNRTRKSDQLALGVSPRGTLMLQRAAQARAFLDGRDFCLPDDFKQLAIPVFSRTAWCLARAMLRCRRNQRVRKMFCAKSWNRCPCQCNAVAFANTDC